MDLISWFDCPPFAKAWSLLADKWGRDPKWKGYTKMRMTAYAAKQAGDSALAAEAKQLMAASLTDNGQERYPASLKVIEGPTVAEKVMEITHLDTPGVSQFALNLLTTSELLRQMGA
jgi:hypothetical protein